MEGFKEPNILKEPDKVWLKVLLRLRTINPSSCRTLSDQGLRVREHGL
jgi:hypothetical protein